VDSQRQKHLVLILAREFASNLATPTLIADARGRLVFYNEAAEAVLGRRFAEAGEMELDEWTASFAPRTLDAVPIPAERRPARIAFDERRAADGFDDVVVDVAHKMCGVFVLKGAPF
jgi:PAS domain-containing protein